VKNSHFVARQKSVSGSIFSLCWGDSEMARRLLPLANAHEKEMGRKEEKGSPSKGLKPPEKGSGF